MMKIEIFEIEMEKKSIINEEILAAVLVFTTIND